MKTIAITVEDESQSEIYSISIEGELVLNNAYEIKQCLLSALDSSKNISLHLRNIENIDLSFIQLLYSFKNTLEAANHKIELNTELSSELISILNHSGFKEILPI